MVKATIYNSMLLKSMGLLAVGLASVQTGAVRLTAQAGRATAASQARVDETRTQLPDGRWLVTGGRSPKGAVVAEAAIVDPATGRTTVLPSPMKQARVGHSATVLPNGTVLLIGGSDGRGLAEVPELFNPATGTFDWFSIVGAAGRELHSATLLPNGHLVVLGGQNGGTTPLPSELWDIEAHTATVLGGGGMGRAQHSAALIDDGRVLVDGGHRLDDTPAKGAVVVNAETGAQQLIEKMPLTTAPTNVAGSLPAAGATQVSLDAPLAIRFSDAVNAGSTTSQTIRLVGPEGPVATRIIRTEEGRLIFLWPSESLADDTPYKVIIAGAIDARGAPVVPTTISFSTRARPQESADTVDADEWIPDAESAKNGWRTNRPASPWESLQPLTAPPGVTAVSGRVLTLDGRPLPNVTLELSGVTTETDQTGRFLLTLPNNVQGHRILEIQGSSANRQARRYGFFEYGMEVTANQTTILPFSIWMPRLDTRHVVTIPSPTNREVVITTPSIPGLELHIPPRTTIRSEDGKTVTQVGITAIPVDRPPFPLARNVEVPVYFTIQPGSAYVSTAGPRPNGAWLVYPNYEQRGVPGQEIQFFHYDPEDKGWFVYGVGRVTPNGAQVVPNADTRLYEFTGAMINGSQSPPGSGAAGGGSGLNDPVDPSTGVFVMHNVDLFLPDPIPLSLTRTYNSGDNLIRPFGRGMTHPYSMFLWSAQQYQQADLILPEGGRVHYVRTSAGTSYTDAVFAHQETATTSATPTRFYKSILKWNGNGWDLTLVDGTVYVFGENAPLQAIRDRYGNTVTVAHATGQTGNITSVTSATRSITFTYDASNRITQARDNSGRTVSYTYDANGNLSTVTDPENGVTTYTYTSNLLATIRSPRNIVYLTNTYTSGRVTQQTFAAPGSTYTFSYTVVSGSVTQTSITDPRGHVRRLTFNANHYLTSDTQAFGTALQRTTTIERQAGTNFILATVDPLNRRTQYTRNSFGNVLTVTRLAGTPDAKTTTITYDTSYNLPATLTDAMNHTWTLGYNTSGVLTTATDPLGHQRTFEFTDAGRISKITDALSHSWTFGYSGGDLVSVTDPLSNIRSRFIDNAGRPIRLTDPSGTTVSATFDKLNRVTSVIDSNGAQTSFAYDANTNLQTLTDALSHPTTFTYDNSDRVITRTDALSQAVSYQYDLVGNVTQVTDRKNQTTVFSYDALDRLSQITFADASTIAIAYDAGSRITQIADSLNGTITRTYNALNLLAQESTSEGTIAYTYNADGLRTSMTVSGQASVNYSYDDAHRLTSITQGATSVAFGYDNADRRSTTTLPNGIIASYGYDAANRLTNLTYTLGGNPVGDVSYAYDASGKRVRSWGSWSRTNLPMALSSATYDANNRISSWNGTTVSYDSNGNLSSDGTTTYGWNARDQLVSLTGGSTAAFAYDGAARRRSATINSATRKFLHDGYNVVQELDGSGAVTASLLTSLEVNETLARTDAGGTSSLLSDGIGSTEAIADSSGIVQTSYTYDPYGNTTTSGAASPNEFRYTGHQDDGTGLYFAHARYISSTLGRFISEDPIGFEGGLNLYAYALGSPTNFADPLGLQPKNPYKCDPLCQLLRDIGNRAAPVTQPLTLAEFVGVSAVGGTAGVIAAELFAGASETTILTRTVVHFTNEAGWQAISESGYLRAGTWVTLPDGVAGMTPAEIEAFLEIDGGKGVIKIIIEVPATGLRVPGVGQFTSGGGWQWQLVRPVILPR